MNTYYVTARLTARQGHEDELHRAILENIPHVLKEDGCQRYELLRSRDNPCVFLFQEIWRDHAALEAHSKAPHMLRYRERTAHLLEKPTEVLLWSAAE